MALPGLAEQDSAWLSGVWRPGTGSAQGGSQAPASAQGASQVASQFSDIDWRTSPEGVAGKAYASCGESLGGHLTAAVKEKIGKGEYVDIFSLSKKAPSRIVAALSKFQPPRGHRRSAGRRAPQ